MRNGRFALGVCLVPSSVAAGASGVARQQQPSRHLFRTVLAEQRKAAAE